MMSDIKEIYARFTGQKEMEQKEMRQKEDRRRNSMRLYKVLSCGVFCVLLCGVLCGCADDLKPSIDGGSTSVRLKLTLPLNAQDPVLEEAEVTLKNIHKPDSQSSYRSTQFCPDDADNASYSDTLCGLPAGVYDIEARGTVSYVAGGVRTRAEARTEHNNVEVRADGTPTIVLGLNIFNAQEGLLLTEIFYTGTLTPEGKQYVDDQYFKIGNNSDSTLYLDGLAFVESDFLTMKKLNATPDIMPTAMTIDVIYCFPGTGREHPLEPGQETLVALKALDHRERNANSIDLSTADFEIYTETRVSTSADSDNPLVPNMDNWYDYSMSYLVLHNRGYKAYALARPAVDRDTFLRDYHYRYDYTFASGEFVYSMADEAYMLPNLWVVDAVNLSVESVFQWIVTSPVLDAGWTSCGSVDNDKTRYNKAVVRKRADNGKWIDTNNSTHDFWKDAERTVK